MPRLRLLGPRVATFDTRSAKPPDKVALPFYSSPEWRDLVNKIIAARGRRCEDPHCSRPFGPWGKIEGDHIVELNDGGAALDAANVMLRCASCHVRKTGEARAARQAAQAAPRPPGQAAPRPAGRPLGGGDS